MRYDFRTAKLQRLHDTEAGAEAYPPEVVDRFFEVIGIIRAASDSRDIRAFKSLRLEKLKGKRRTQHSLRLNKQWRLIIEVEKGEPNTIWIVDIEDYH